VAGKRLSQHARSPEDGYPHTNHFILNLFAIVAACRSATHSAPTKAAKPWIRGG
jgi:hypothetical protein